MKTIRLLVLGCALVLVGTSVAGNVYADPSQAAAPGSLIHNVSIASPVEDHPRTSEEKEHHKHRQRKFHHGRGLHEAAHYETYLKLLVAKYAPDTKQEWDDVLKESARLRSDLHQTMAALPPEARQKWKESHKDKSSAQWQNKRAKVMETHRAFDAAVQSQDQIRIQLALNDMLKVCRQQNEYMTYKLSELQKAGTAAPKAS
ncbi:hypothetical protein [Paenibacillus daejeonensis]|uniref:hypothetical protein n=1 Tax=Paenibacillus daejeonensis TaxID=135193 RepID=UPI0003760802|nr:hypothetical protein [Paenibacillus daejeonensis]